MDTHSPTHHPPDTNTDTHAGCSPWIDRQAARLTCGMEHGAWVWVWGEMCMGHRHGWGCCCSLLLLQAAYSQYGVRNMLSELTGLDRIGLNWIGLPAEGGWWVFLAQGYSRASRVISLTWELPLSSQNPKYLTAKPFVVGLVMKVWSCVSIHGNQSIHCLHTLSDCMHASMQCWD